jgi:hypothetical protein
MLIGTWWSILRVAPGSLWRVAGFLYLELDREGGTGPCASFLDTNGLNAKSLFSIKTE